jgi:hypothetical protein
MRTAIRGLLVALFVFAGFGCGTLKYEVPGTARAPGADAKITAEVNKGQGNTKLEILAENLPPPDRLQPGTTAFVVWQRKNDQAPWQRVGALNYDKGKRKGTLEATAPEVKFELVITAEQSASPASPSGNIMFQQQVGK